MIVGLVLPCPPGRVVEDEAGRGGGRAVVAMCGAEDETGAEREEEEEEEGAGADRVGVTEDVVVTGAVGSAGVGSTLGSAVVVVVVVDGFVRAGITIAAVMPAATTSAPVAIHMRGDRVLAGLTGAASRERRASSTSCADTPLPNVAASSGAAGAPATIAVSSSRGAAAMEAVRSAGPRGVAGRGASSLGGTAFG